MGAIGGIFALRSQKDHTDLQLELLAALVVGGVTLVVALTAAFGWTAGATLDPSGARARYLEDFPDDRILDLRLGDARRAALLDVGDAVGVVAVLGDRALTRRLTARELRSVTEDTGEGAGLVLRLRDLGAPRLRVAVADPAERQAWRDRLERV